MSLSTNYVSLAAELGIQGFLAGKEYRARCPLHHDRNPSFSMNVENGLWICHRGCGQGEFIELVERVYNCSSQEAREWVHSNGNRVAVDKISTRLAQELGMVPGEVPQKAENLGWRRRYEAMTDKIMPLWFLERGFSWETIWHWRIRYDPTFDSVTIPVLWEEQLVGTVTRHSKPEHPKYENSVELPRSEILFGEISNAHGTIIICEGALDMLWLWQLGYSAIGLLGTSMSRRQTELLKHQRLGEVVLALDNDEAGITATAEVTRQLTKAGWLLPQISFIRFPTHKKDPQDCSKEEFQVLYEQRKGMVFV